MGENYMHYTFTKIVMHSARRFAFLVKCLIDIRYTILFHEAKAASSSILHPG